MIAFRRPVLQEIMSDMTPYSDDLTSPYPLATTRFRNSGRRLNNVAIGMKVVAIENTYFNGLLSHSFSSLTFLGLKKYLI